MEMAHALKSTSYLCLPDRGYESEEMEVYEANPKVGNVRNNGPEMLRAAAVATEDGMLPL